jgi:cysteine desulfurase
MNNIYFDNAATTPLRNEVIESMTQVMKSTFGNASSTHNYGRLSKALIEKSRKTIASFLNCSASEIVFTSGGTEADNLVLRSAVKDVNVIRIITSKIEHHAILHTIEALVDEFNITVDYVSLDKYGSVDVSHLDELLKSSTDKTLVSLMHVNNEIGNKLNLKSVAELCKTYNALFHSDAVQSVGHYTLDLQIIPVDFLAASAHKFHGPKGVGFAFIRKNSGLKASIFGGEQERGYRAGTEAIHNIVGMEEALRLSYVNLEKERNDISDLKQYFIQQLQKEIPNVSFNGNCLDAENSAYNILNVRLPMTPEKGAMLHFQLDLRGIACSKGSACQSGSNQNSHVLTQILSPSEILQPSVRFSLSVFNTKDEVDYVVDVLKSLV